jgi:hypothetical protein
MGPYYVYFPIKENGTMDDLASRLTIADFPNSQQEARQPARLKKKSQNSYVPTVPLHVIKACALGDCEVVLPLVLATHRQLKMTGREWTPRNRAVWVSAGDPPERKREKILRVLKARPELILIRRRKTATSHYEVAYGAAWAARD